MFANIMNENNPDRAREIFNNYFQLNKQIEVSLDKKYRNWSSFLQNTGEFIKKIVGEHENDFLSAFEQKMYVVQKDMRDLKDKASAERIKAK